jgi:hypothetical protein
MKTVSGDLEIQLATTILSRHPTAASFRGVSVKKLADRL